MVHISTFKGVHCVLWYIHFEMEWHTTITNHSKTTDVLKLSHKAYVCAKQDDEAIAAQTHTHTHTYAKRMHKTTNKHSQPRITHTHAHYLYAKVFHTCE